MTREKWLEAIKPFSVGDFAVLTYSRPEVVCPRCGRSERRLIDIKGKVGAIDDGGITIAGKRRSYRMAYRLDVHPHWLSEVRE